MAKQTKSTAKENKFVEFSRDVIYASLGVQKTAYDFGVDKYTAFTKQTKKDVKAYIKRGEQVEAQIKGLYEDIKDADNLVGKSVASVEEQVEKAAKLVAELSDKVSAVVPKRTPVRKAKTAVKRSAPAKRRAPAKRSAASKAA